MERTKSASLPLALALAVAACSTAPRGARFDSAEVGEARFPDADLILAGFDSAQTGADWRAGDRVLYALTTRSGARTHAELVELELLGPCTPALGDGAGGSMQIVESMKLVGTVGNRKVEWTSPLLRVAVRVYEEDARLVQQTEAKVPETVLQSGLHPALELCDEFRSRAALAAGAPLQPSDQEVRVLAEAAGMLPTLLGILEGDSVLRSLLMQVVGPPPLLSLLSGVQVDLSCDLGGASKVSDSAAVPCAQGSVYRIPVHVTVNGSPTLELELAVVAADPPLRLSGGILSMSGVASRGSDRTVTLELLAARRGPPGAEIR